MPSPLHGLRPPYTLPSGVVFFHDWRYVNHGAHRWLRHDGTSLPLFTLEEPGPMRYERYNMPLGIEISAEPAAKSEPVLWPELAGEIFLFAGSLIQEDGRYRLWFECWPKEHFGTKDIGHKNYVRYMESENGTDWKAPRLGAGESKGGRDNIVFGAMQTGEIGYHGGCVFKDPSAPASERYKAFFMGMMSPEMVEKYRRERPGELDPFMTRIMWGLFGAVSPDGFGWTFRPEPMVAQNSDTHNVCEYDPARGAYVAYCRSHFFNRRTIGRMESADFRRFPLPEELFWPNATMAPYDLWYKNAKTVMPGAPDYHLMFPMRWRLTDDSFDFHLATSPDGIVWGMTPGGPVVTPGRPGEWDEGVTAPGLGMVDLPGERIGILYSGSPVPHKHPRKPPLGKLAWASWPKDRLVALKARDEGGFALWPLMVKGRKARLNFRTRFAGFVKVEAAGADGKTLPGRSFEDCDAIGGDSLGRVITWRGESDLGHREGEPVTLRFSMRSADLFSVRFGD